MSRGQSAEPELIQLGGSLQRPPPPRFDRSRSVGPCNGNRASKYLPRFDEEVMTSSGSDRALINQHVNPYTEFPSLRRGLTSDLKLVDGQNQLQEVVKVRGEGDVCAYYFWAITLFFFCFAVLNFLVLISIVIILGIGPEGLSSVEFLPHDGSIKFLKDVLAPDLTVSGVIRGYSEEPMNIFSENGDIVFRIFENEPKTAGKLPELRIGNSEISFTNVDSFKVVDPDTGEILFDAHAPEFELDEKFESLSVPELETNRIVSPLHQDLLIQSDAKLDMVGTEGVVIDSKTISMNAGDHIIVDSTTLTVDGDISIDPLGLPLGGGGYPVEKPQYKLCICYPSGKLFTIPVVRSHFRSVNCQSKLPYSEKHPCEDE